ncbi:MAG: hypothetical protein M1824_003532 [Vezdaea acicularis]|nr:MAG: hypothetical protein M1824_003532 [Vezdaea acicularis]
MSSSANARGSTYPNRRPPSSYDTTRARAPSGANRERDRHEPRRTDSPQLSNIDDVSRRAASGSHRANGSVSERRTERTNVTTRENVVVRTKSPTKSYAEEGATIKGDRDREAGRAGGRAGVGSSAGLKKEREQGQELAWTPQVTLVPHTTAPLAPRTSNPPLASKAPQSLEPRPLNQLSLELQEAVILEDLLFVFMGCEGQYIRFVDSYNPAVEKDRLAGPSFRILPGLDPSLRDLTNTMLKMATHYGAIEVFVEVQSREEFGAVNHALCAAIRKLLKDYLVLIAQLEHQLLTNPSFTLHVLHLHTLPTSHMLQQVYSLAHEILKKNSLLEEDLEDSVDEYDDVENILESLREGGELGPGGMSSKKICKGGTVLGLLTQRLASMSGDPAARSLLTSLLREASRPYMTMLNEWLHHGGIKDPHAEFLVKEQKSIRRERLEEDYTDEYWEKRYTIRDSDVPPQLEGVREKVLLAGKYLNVVRECGGVDVSKAVQDVPKTFDDIRFLDNVNGAYAHANSSLLNLLLTTHALPARLRSLKHYFFLDRSDFFSYFLELSTSELKKPARAVNVNKLQSLLDLVLRQPGSVAAHDPFKEDVKVQMNEVGLTKWLMRVVSVSGIDQDGTTPNGGDLDKYTTTTITPATTTTTAAAPPDDDKNIIGFNALELDYTVPFPLSLVISRKTVLRYQLLFRYLLSLRHLETQLSAAWTEHARLPAWKHKSSSPAIELWKRRAWTLRARMLVFVQQLLYFCTAEVIEPNWQALMARLNETDEVESGGSGAGTGSAAAAAGQKKVDRTVDELMQDHVDFLDTCLKECMLTNSKLLKIHSKIMVVCSMYASYTLVLSRHLLAADPDLCSSSSPPSSSNHPSTDPPSSTTTQQQHDPTRLAKLSDNLAKYEDNFSRHLKILLDVLNYFAATETVRFLGLCARLSAASEGVDATRGGEGREVGRGV